MAPRRHLPARTARLGTTAFVHSSARPTKPSDCLDAGPSSCPAPDLQPSNPSNPPTLCPGALPPFRPSTLQLQPSDPPTLQLSYHSPPGPPALYPPIRPSVQPSEHPPVHHPPHPPRLPPRYPHHPSTAITSSPPTPSPARSSPAPTRALPSCSRTAGACSPRPRTPTRVRWPAFRPSGRASAPMSRP